MNETMSNRLRMKHRNEVPHDPNFAPIWTIARMSLGSNQPGPHWDDFRAWIRDCEFDGYWYARHSDCESYLEVSFTNPDAAFAFKMRFG